MRLLFLESALRGKRFGERVGGCVVVRGRIRGVDSSFGIRQAKNALFASRALAGEVGPISVQRFGEGVRLSKKKG